MWIPYTLLTFACWGIADLFYKIGNKGKGDYNHLKTGIFVGIVMGIHATVYLLLNKVSINIEDIFKYLPVSLCYISSMVIGYKGLKYLELSISSPIQNTSGVITSILLIIFFKEKFDIPVYGAFLLIFIGIILLSMYEVKANKKKRFEYKKNNTMKKVFFLTILFPLAYCLLDGLGTFLDAIFLDKKEIVTEDVALIAYEYTFFIYALFNILYLKLMRVKLFNISKEKNKLFAALFETAGQFFYVFAMSNNSTIAASIIGSYCILSAVLSHVLLREKLNKKQYIYISLVIIGIIILSIYDV